MGNMSESATLALNARAKQLAASGKEIYNLTAGELAEDTPDYIQTAVRKTLHLNKYTPVAGLPELREGIAKAAADFYGKNWIEPDNIVVTAGAKPALYAAFQALINPGDEVIVPVPAWVSYRHLIELAGGKVVETPLTDSFDLDIDAIAGKLSPNTKAIIINSPHNPTGAVFSPESLRSLAKLLKDTSVTVIADDIYAKLTYEDTFVPVSACDFEKIITVNGFSKSQALTGWRIGYLIAERELAQAVTGLLSHVMGNAPLPSQQAALAALRRHDTPESLPRLKQQRELVNNTLKTFPRIRYHLPGGAFYVFIDIRAISTDSIDWCERLLVEKGVALVPGEAFSAPGFVRLSFVTDATILQEGLNRIRKFIIEGKTA